MGQLLFKKCFWNAIRAGEKRTTIRRWDKPRFAANRRVYSLGLGWLKIDSIETIDDLAKLTLADAQADGFASVDDLLATLKSMYPDTAGDGKRWYLVRFHADALLPVAPTTSESPATKGLFDPW